MSWWVPFAFVGAAIVGLVIALSLTAGRPRGPAAAEEVLPEDGGRLKSRYEEDNALVWNPAAFVAAAALVGLLVLVAILIEVL
jgi:hydrogenase/urease accessory protein HupE